MSAVVGALRANLSASIAQFQDDMGKAADSVRKFASDAEKQGKKLELLGNDDETANFQYVKHFLMDDWKLLGERFGMGYAEAFRYIGPPANYQENVRKYADQHAVRL